MSTPNVWTAGSGADGKLGQGKPEDSSTFREVVLFAREWSSASPRRPGVASASITASAGASITGGLPASASLRYREVSCGSYNTVFVTEDGEILICGLGRSPKDGSSLLGAQQTANQMPRDRDAQFLVPVNPNAKPTPPPRRLPPSTALPKPPPPVPPRSGVVRGRVSIPQGNPGQTSPSITTSGKSQAQGGNASITAQDDQSNLPKSRSQPDLPAEDRDFAIVSVPTTVHKPASMSASGVAIRQVSLGNYHSLALTETGRVFSWGSGRFGQLGLGSQMAIGVPELVGGLSSVRRVACGTSFCAAVTDWGELYTWGDNTTYQLGHGDTLMRQSPTRVSRLKGCVICDVSCGNAHVACLGFSRDVYSWGQCSEDGQPCPIPALVDLSDIVQPPVVVSKVSCGGWHTSLLLNSGVAYEWKFGGDVQPLLGELSLQSVRDIACGNFHTICLCDSGLVFTSGRNNCFQLGRQTSKPTEPLPGVVSGLPALGADEGHASKISAGEFHSAVLTDSSARFAQARRLVSLVRDYFRHLAFIVRGYRDPIGERVQATLLQLESPSSSVRAAKGKRKSFSFTLKKQSPPSPQEAPPAVPLGQSMRSVFATGAPAVSGTASLRSSVHPLATLRAVPPERRLHNRYPALFSSSLNMSGSSIQQDLVCPTAPGATAASSKKNLAISAFDLAKPSKRPASQHCTIASDADVTRTGSGIVGLFLQDDEFLATFSNVEEVFFSTAQLLGALDAKLSNWNGQQTLGDVLMADSFVSALRQYVVYCDSYTEAQVTLSNVRHRCPAFTEFVRDLERAVIKNAQPPVHGDPTLSALLILPIQFVPRLLTAVQELAAVTPESHSDRNLLDQAKDKLDMLIFRLNENFQFKEFSREILRCTSTETGNPQIMGGTLQLLVEKLTHHNLSDPRFREVFLLTYRTFCGTNDLLRELVARYEALKSEPWQNRQRVFHVLSAWVVTSWSDLSANEQSMKGLSDFLESSSVNDEDAKKYAAHIRDLMEAQTRQAKLAPASIIPTHRPCTSLLVSPLDHFSPADIARAITVQDHQTFRAVESRELFDKGWEKPDSSQRCPNLCALTKRFNRLGSWISSQLENALPKQKQTAYSKVVELADRLLALNNISAFVAVVYELMTLDKLRKEAGREQQAKLEVWERLVSPERNSKRLRKLMTEIRPPCVPFMGLYLKDLTFIDDGNNDFLQESAQAPSPSGSPPSQPVINFYKRRKLAEVLQQLKQYQQVLYVETPESIEPTLWNYLLWEDPVPTSPPPSPSPSVTTPRDPALKTETL